LYFYENAKKGKEIKKAIIMKTNYTRYPMTRRAYRKNSAF